VIYLPCAGQPLRSVRGGNRLTQLSKRANLYNWNYSTRSGLCMEMTFTLLPKKSLKKHTITKELQTLTVQRENPVFSENE